MAMVAGVLALVLVFLLLVAVYLNRRAWREHKAYRPSPTLCAAVHRHQAGWLKTALGLFVIPDKISTLGFVGAALWPAMVGVNLVFLTPVFSLFFEGGVRWTVPGLGTYNSTALLAALLFSISQSLFGLAAERAKARGLKAAFGLLLVLTIFVEAGLAFYRATILIGGEEKLSDTLVDQVMVKLGPWLVAAIGSFVPIAHTACGYVGFSGFIEPAITYVFRFVGGVGLLAWSALAYVLFGFHDEAPTLLPRWAEALSKEGRDLLAQATRLDGAAGELRGRQQSLERSQRLLAGSTSLATLADDAKQLVGEKRNHEVAWGNEYKALLERFRLDSSRPDLDALRVLATDVTRSSGSTRDTARRVNASVATLAADVDRAGNRPKLLADREACHQRLTEQGSDLQAQREELVKRAVVLEKTQKEVMGLWSGSPNALTTLAGQDAQIRQIKDLAESLAAGSRELVEAKALFDHCHSLVSQSLADPLAASRRAADTAVRAEQAAAAALAASGAPTATNAPAPATAPPALLGDVEEVRSIVDVAQRHSENLDALNQRIAARCREIERKPPWWWWFKELVGWRSENAQ